jgi:hypothetical protein
MVNESPPSPPSRDDLVVQITTLLETYGIDDRSYQVYDTVDVEALSTLRQFGPADPEVRFTIEGVPLVVTKDDVRVADGWQN